MDMQKMVLEAIDNEELTMAIMEEIEARIDYVDLAEEIVDRITDNDFTGYIAEIIASDMVTLPF